MMSSPQGIEWQDPVLVKLNVLTKWNLRDSVIWKKAHNQILAGIYGTVKVMYTYDGKTNKQLKS